MKESRRMYSERYALFKRSLIDIETTSSSLYNTIRLKNAFIKFFNGYMC